MLAARKSRQKMKTEEIPTCAVKVTDFQGELNFLELHTDKWQKQGDISMKTQTPNWKACSSVAGMGDLGEIDRVNSATQPAQGCNIRVWLVGNPCSSFPQKELDFPYGNVGCSIF